MALEVPKTLSPSKVSTFKDCALRFRLSAIDRLEEAPSEAATKGTMVHLALEHLMGRPSAERTVDAALDDLRRAHREMADDPELVGLGLDDEQEAAFLASAETLVRNYFRLEDPTTVRGNGLELMLGTDVTVDVRSRDGDGQWTTTPHRLHLRGIIDRLDIDDDGEITVVDYKSGRAPSERFEQGRLSGVHFYAYLCERFLGRAPKKVQLLYLADPVTITATPSAQSIRGLGRRVEAIWSTVVQACERESFRPNPGKLCSYCSYHPYCPAQGGSLDALPGTDARVQPVTLTPASAGGSWEAATAPAPEPSLLEGVGS
jgi:putative RecB family exonuclease